jgi:class 3 adenylate cyclase
MARARRDRDFIRETFGRYVSPEVAERFLRDPDALRLGGELRAVTILMSDLRGFSTLSEALGPEVMITVLNRYLGRMTPVILEHGGLINEFIGDAILVLFGAPWPDPTTPSGRSGAPGPCSRRWPRSTPSTAGPGSPRSPWGSACTTARWSPATSAPPSASRTGWWGRR